MPTRSKLSAVFLPVVFLVLCGCSDAGPKLDLHPCVGVVTRDGEPVAGGGMMFRPEDAAMTGFTVNASVDLDGTFVGETLQTGRDGRTTARHGVPAGKYRVIYHPLSDGSRMGLETELLEPIQVEVGPNTITIKLPTSVPREKGVPREDQ